MTNLFNILVFFGTIIFWLAVFFWLIKKQSPNKKSLLLILVVGLLVIAGTIGNSVYASYQQSKSGDNLLSQYLSEYVFKTGVERLSSHWLATAGFVILLTLLLVWLWRAKRGLVIDGVDVMLLALGMLTVQWPQLLVFLLLVFVLVLLIQVILVALKKRTINDRLIITPAIPLAVILTLFYGQYLVMVTGLDVIRF